MSHSDVYRRAAVALHFALIGAIVAQSGFSSGALLALPLLAPLPGLLRARAYTSAWASMLLSFYTGGYLSAAYAQPQTKWISIGIAALAGLEFLSLVLFVRLRRREAAPAAAAPPSPAG